MRGEREQYFRIGGPTDEPDHVGPFSSCTITLLVGEPLHEPREQWLDHGVSERHKSGFGGAMNDGNFVVIVQLA